MLYDDDDDDDDYDDDDDGNAMACDSKSVKIRVEFRALRSLLNCQ